LFNNKRSQSKQFVIVYQNLQSLLLIDIRKQSYNLEIKYKNKVEL